MQRGVTLIETIVYITIFMLLSFALVITLVVLNRSYGSVRSSVVLDVSAQDALDRILRGVRDGTSIDIANSSFGTSSPGMLGLNTKDDTGATTTVKFSLSNQVIRIAEDGVDIGPISSSKMKVTTLTFYQFATPNSKAVRVEMTAETGEGANYKSRSFYTTAVLRGTYAP